MRRVRNLSFYEILSTSHSLDFIGAEPIDAKPQHKEPLPFDEIIAKATPNETMWHPHHSQDAVEDRPHAPHYDDDHPSNHLPR